LFCFAHAGAGATVYSSWPQHLQEDIEVYGVQLPGREDRADEVPFASVEPLMNALMPELRSLARCPFVLYGHSMGALLAFEVARRSVAEWGYGPALLAVSGFPAPDRLSCTGPPLHQLSDEQLLEHLARLEGPRASLDDQRVIDSILPVLRADIAACENYTYTGSPPLRCPISAFAGARDPSIAAAGLARWGFHTKGGFNARVLPGSHFFIEASRRELLNALSQDIVACLD
jgi:medium-chain acyl-[acyl-carrier-protein] hydrolase